VFTCSVIVTAFFIKGYLTFFIDKTMEKLKKIRKYEEKYFVINV